MVRRKRLRLPDWYNWDFLLSAHVERRMDDRGFNEVALRSMLATPTGVRPAAYPGRFVVTCEHGAESWIVVVEPDFEDRAVVVVTAYRPE